MHIGDEVSVAAFQQELVVHLNAYLANFGISFREIKVKSKIIYDPFDFTRESNKYNGWSHNLSPANYWQASY